MNPLRVLILKDAGLLADISDDLKAWKDYESTRIGLALQIEERVILVGPLKHESFNIIKVSDDESKELYGLSGVKEIIRPQVAQGMYDAVYFVYDIEDSEFYKRDPDAALGSIANWTYFNPLYPGTPFSEIVCYKRFAPQDPFRVFSHEIRHNFCYRLRSLGYPVQDQMDLTYVKEGATYTWKSYYKEYEPLAYDGNRAVQNAILSPFMATLLSRPEVRTFIQQLQDKLALLLKSLASMTTPKPAADSSGMIAWADAIKQHEGWFVGSKSYRNLNPANFRYTPYIVSLGAIGKDSTGFAIFKSYDAGYAALLQFLRDARANQLLAYRKYAQEHGRVICSLADFFEVYAPSTDANNPSAYARAVASAIGCAIETPIDRI